MRMRVTVCMALAILQRGYGSLEREEGVVVADEYNYFDNVTSAPTQSNSSSTPAVTPSVSPSSSPSSSNEKTSASPSSMPSSSPTVMPSSQPTDASKREKSRHKLTFWSVVAKVLAWCIIMLLVFLAFGSTMSNRYRIVRFLRALWFAILSSSCMQWLMRKVTGRDYQSVDSSLNTAIFEHDGFLNNEMTSGLLLREND